VVTELFDGGGASKQNATKPVEIEDPFRERIKIN